MMPSLFEVFLNVPKNVINGKLVYLGFWKKLDFNPTQKFFCAS